MYENLIETLRFCAKNGDCHDCPYEKPCAGTMGDGLYCEAADAIEELSKQHEQQRQNLIALMNEKPRLIPVTERLPKYGDWVLGIGPKKGYHVCEYRGITHFPYSGDIPWFSAKGRTLNITHWMPLPEPPKEET